METKRNSKVQTAATNASISIKQVIVSVIILSFAVCLLIYAFSAIFLTKDNTKEKIVQVPEVVQVPEKSIEEPVQKPEENKEVETPEKVVEPEIPQVTTLNFTATTDTDFEYEIFYTDKQYVWFTPDKSFTHKAVKGKNTYSIELPETKVYRIRLDFGSNPVNITIKDIHLSGEQNVDLNNFDAYEYNDIQNKTINEDGSITLSSEGRDPYMAYRIE